MNPGTSFRVMMSACPSEALNGAVRLSEVRTHQPRLPPPQGSEVKPNKDKPGPNCGGSLCEDFFVASLNKVLPQLQLELKKSQLSTSRRIVFLLLFTWRN